MDALIQANVFFFITSISVIVLTAALLYAILQVVSILREVHRFMRIISDGTEALSEDIREVRECLRQRGVLTGFILSIISAIMGYRARAKKRARQKDGV